jgi:hypothetical protein
LCSSFSPNAQNVLATQPSPLSPTKLSTPKQKKLKQPETPEDSGCNRKVSLPDWLPKEVWTNHMVAYVLDRVGVTRDVWDLGDKAGCWLHVTIQDVLNLMIGAMPELGVSSFELETTDALYRVVRPLSNA